MEKLTTTILSDVLWNLLKKGVSVTKDYLSSKLSKWGLGDEELEKIEEVANNIPNVYLKSKGMLKEYLELDETIQYVLKTTVSTQIVVNQDIVTNNGIAVGVMQNGNINFNTYNNKEKPRDTYNTDFLLTSGFTKYKPVQIVKSFSSTRDNCHIIDDNKIATLHTDIYIPEKVKLKEDCNFVMLLFPYSPPENLENYSKEGYFLEFNLNTSKNIHLVQLQIKNSKQKQFIDLSIDDGYFSCKLSDMASDSSWQDVSEICFTIFADNKYITGENGYIEIKGLKLSKCNS